MSAFGRLVRLTLFGESHGRAVGALLTGFPPGVAVDEAFVQGELDRRRPGQSAVTTQRKEEDRVEFVSGVHEGRTTGAPLLMVAWNQDKDPSKYTPDTPRPGHADLAAHLRFFGHHDWRGGGHFGGRLTFGIVAAGALARLALRRFGTQVVAYTEAIGDLGLAKDPAFDEAAGLAEANAVRCPDAELAQAMQQRILATRKAGDSLGGVVRCRIGGVPAGLGGYHQESFESRIAQVLFGVPAVKGVGFGLGFGLSRLTGTQANDAIGMVAGRPQGLTSKQGGTVGGVTDGSEVSFAVAFKPTSSVLVPQRTVDLSTRQATEVVTKGRHDPCIVPRAVPVVQNATALVVLDLLMERLGQEGFQARGVDAP